MSKRKAYVKIIYLLTYEEDEVGEDFASDDEFRVCVGDCAWGLVETGDIRDYLPHDVEIDIVTE